MNKKGLTPLVIAVIVVAAIAIVAYFLLPSGTGTLALKITDAPAGLNVSKALVTISAVQVHKAAAGAENDTNFTAGWLTVVEGPLTYDLIAIKDVKEVLGEKELDAGKYTQIRLSVDSAVVTIDGKESALETPSDKIKMIQPFTITSGETTTLTLDFDAAESIKASGKDEYKLQPVIKVIQES